MIRVLSLVWTLVLSLLTVGVSFFYITDTTKHGYPFTFANDVTDSTGVQSVSVNYWSVAIDVFVWWLLFSIFWIILKNYILQVD